MTRSMVAKRPSLTPRERATWKERAATAQRVCQRCPSWAPRTSSQTFMPTVRPALLSGPNGQREWLLASVRYFNAELIQHTLNHHFDPGSLRVSNRLGQGWALLFVPWLDTSRVR
jgi:hypothetical protein